MNYLKQLEETADLIVKALEAYGSETGQDASKRHTVRILIERGLNLKDVYSEAVRSNEVLSGQVILNYSYAETIKKLTHELDTSRKDWFNQLEV